MLNMVLLLGEGLKTQTEKNQIFAKKKAIRAVNNSTSKTHSNPLFSKLKVLYLGDSYKQVMLLYNNILDN